MVSVDQRTRRDDELTAVDPQKFFDEELPLRFVLDGGYALPGARELLPRPLAVSVGSRTWTLAVEDDALLVHRGDPDAAAHVVLDEEQLTDLVHDVRTPMGFLTGGDLRQDRGRLDDLLDWWVLLRAVLDQRPAHTAGAVDFVDLDGAPLDLHRSLSLADPPEVLAHFLGQAGFLHLADVFADAEMAAISRDIDEALPRFTPDDGRSWWATTAAGEQRAVRLQHFQDHSATTSTLLDDERLRAIAALTEDGHELDTSVRGGNLVEALVKPLDVVEGISDLPWHKDCSLGRHSYRCCSMTVGVSVTGADASSGQLRVVAGSHRALIQPAFVRKGLDLPDVPLPTRTGDVTVHLSCTLHMSQAPRLAERRVLYTAFRLPDEGRTSPETERKLSRIREGSYKNVSQPPAAPPPG